MKEKDQLPLFDLPSPWRESWTGMPDFDHEDQTPWQTIKVHFRNAEDRSAFEALTGQRITDRTPSIWFPASGIRRPGRQYVSTTEGVQPRYPVYVISKGRWESRRTVKALDKIGVPFKIVIEPQEYPQYSAVIDPEKILVLPFSNLGQGSIPARNWVWDHSCSRGDARHWILDDNLLSFYRYQNNFKVKVTCGNTFVAAEDFADRYTNLAICGFNYFMFVRRKYAEPAYVLNTRIYSCMLIQNDIPYRWRGRYNEDTDLSLRVLKDGWCTVNFNAFIVRKATTMTMKGGNTDELYKDDGRLKMAESLRDQHPDCVRITQKWNRYQHQVNYRPFKQNRLILKPEYVGTPEPNNFGMELEITEGDRASA